MKLCSIGDYIGERRHAEKSKEIAVGGELRRRRSAQKAGFLLFFFRLAREGGGGKEKQDEVKDGYGETGNVLRVGNFRMFSSGTTSSLSGFRLEGTEALSLGLWKRDLLRDSDRHRLLWEAIR